MTSSSVTDFLISLPFLAAGGYAVLMRLRTEEGKPDVRDQHEAIAHNNRPHS